MQAIVKSLQEFGQQRPIIVDKHNQVLAGNGTLAAFIRLGWKTIQVVCTNLDGKRAEAYAIADNKTTDMSHFDYQALSEVLRDLEGAKLDLDVTGFQAFEREPLLQADWNPGEASAMPTGAGSKRKLEPEDWTHIDEAIAWARANCTDYDTESDEAALIAFCYTKLNT